LKSLSSNPENFEWCAWVLVRTSSSAKRLIENADSLTGYSGLMLAYKYKNEHAMTDYVDLKIYEKNRPFLSLTPLFLPANPTDREGQTTWEELG
jgi:hypothetical protein